MNYTYKFQSLKITSGDKVVFDAHPCVVDIGNKEDGAVYDAISNKVYMNQGKSKFNIEELGE